MHALKPKSDCVAAHSSSLHEQWLPRRVYWVFLGVALLAVMLSGAELMISWRLDAPSNSADWFFLMAASRFGMLILLLLFGGILYLGSLRPRDAKRGDGPANVHFHEYNKMTHLDRLHNASQLVSGIAHEIDQPLSAISNYAAGCTKLLENTNLEHEQILLALDQVHRNAQHAGEIIRSLRDFVSKREAHRERVQCNEIITTSMALLKAESQTHRSNIQLELTPELPEVLADPILLEQVLLNLVRNAAQARQERGESPGLIRIRSALDNRSDLRIEVADDGPGVPARHLPKLFTPYFTTKKDGMGIGLSLSRSIVRWHGGDLTFRPNKLGGSTFTIAVPCNGGQIQ